MTAKYSSDARAPRIAVIGGSMAGLFCALLLRRAGADVHVYEHSGESLASRGAGIVTHPPLFEALARGGAPATSAVMGVRSLGRRVFARNGAVLAEMPLEQTLTSWGLLYRALLSEFDARRYHNGMSFESMEQDGAGVRARFANGETREADWLVGADGVRSTVRGIVAPDVTHEYAGYVAWRGLVAEADLPERVLAKLRNRLSFCLPAGEQMLGYLVAGPGENLTPGKRSFNWVWYRPAHPDTALKDLLTDAGGNRNDMSISPGRIRADVIAGVRRDADGLLSTQYRKVVALTRQPFIQPIYDLSSTRLVHGRVILLGDAAFVARPHLGLGVTKAALDAMSLAAAFQAQDTTAALTAWEHERLAFGRSAVSRARALGAYLQAQLQSAAERREAERNRSVEAVMARTASPYEV